MGLTLSVWDFSVHLSCGCEIQFGARTTDEIEALTPRRKDGKFGSLLCPHGHGRRRIWYTRKVTDHVPTVRQAILDEF